MTNILPILPLRDIVVFPQRIVPLFVGREKSVAALEAAMNADKEIFLVAQLDPGEDDPDRDALYDLGVVATAMQLLKLPDGTVRVLVEGLRRARLVGLEKQGDQLLAEVNPARRMEMVFAFMEGELGVLQVEKKIRSRVKRQMEKTQREYYLNEKLKAIQRELGNESEEGGDELHELAEKIRKTRLSKEARNRANSELKKLRAMAPM